jgi:tRNA(adenine34) deaminase
MDRWQDIESAWQLCFKLVWEAYCDGTRPIGAAIYNLQGDLIAYGRNRIESELPIQGQITGGPLAHAEVNAILQIDFDQVNKHECVVYTSLEPCPLCVGAITMAGIKTVHFGARDPWAGATDLWKASEYMRWKAVDVTGPHPRLEPIFHLFSVEGHHRIRQVRSEALLERYSRDFPEGYKWGSELHQRGLLTELHRKGAGPEEVYLALLDFMDEMRH